MLNTTRLPLLCSAALLTLSAACSGDDGNSDDDGTTTTFSKAALTTSNPAGRSMDGIIRAAGRLDAQQATLSQVGAFTSLQSLSVDANGHGYVTLDRFDGTGGIAIYPNIAALTADTSLGGGARTIAGASTELMAPKGVFIANGLNLIIVADFGAKDIKAFSMDASGDVEAQHTIAIGDDRSVWDVHYDSTSDVLWASGTDGVALAYDSFSTAFGDGGPSRTITPTGLGNAKLSVNLHGITYDATLDLLIASDVGDPSITTDGQLFIIAAASTADGDVQATAQITGTASGLGNPVDIYLQNTDLFVAEKSNNTVMRFDGVLTLIGSIDIAADATLDVPSAESITVSAVGGIGGGAILTTSNPTGADDDVIVQAPFTLSGSAATFSALGDVTSIESVALSGDGDGFVSFASGSSGGILIKNNLSNVESDAMLGAGDRMIRGAQTTLVAPKGLDVGSSLIVVADFGAKAITTFAIDAEGDAAPKGTTTDLGGNRSVWDVHFDESNDTVYATGTDGTLLVYESFATNFGSNGPTRMITPAGSVNLHGVVYHTPTDTLFLTDVGDAAANDDGQIFVIKSASTVSGNVTADAVISGAASMLGNPVDCAYDGLRLYVAEKSNDALLRFDAVASLSGTVMVGPDATTAIAKAESVALVP